ncbi:unnamed protein product [Urochloa humidicola]
MASVKGRELAKSAPAVGAGGGGGGQGTPATELEQVFRKYDANGDGKISAEELASVLRALGGGAPPGPGEVRRMMDEMDADRDGFVDLAEFVAFHCGGGGAGGRRRHGGHAAGGVPHARRRQQRAHLRARAPPRPPPARGEVLRRRLLQDDPIRRC